MGVAAGFLAVLADEMPKQGVDQNGDYYALRRPSQIQFAGDEYSRGQQKVANDKRQHVGMDITDSHERRRRGLNRLGPLVRMVSLR